MNGIYISNFSSIKSGLTWKFRLIHNTKINPTGDSANLKSFIDAFVPLKFFYKCNIAYFVYKFDQNYRL